MTTCAVLRCENPGSDVLTSSKLGGFESFVCSDHKAQADAGAPWMRGENSQLLMGEELPPLLTQWQFEEDEGPGIRLILSTDRDGQDQAFRVYLTAEQYTDIAKAMNKGQ